MIAPLHETKLPLLTHVSVGAVVGTGLLGLLYGGAPEHWLIWRDAPQATAVLTSLLTHTSAEHVIYNVLTLGTCGALLERKLGPWALLLVLVSTAFTSTAGWLALDSQAAGLGGASGVTYGLLGACMVLFHQETVRVGAAWPLILAWALGATTLSPFLSLVALGCFVLPKCPGWLLLRGGISIHWLSLPLLAQVVDKPGLAEGAHWGGFLGGALLGSVLLCAPAVVAALDLNVRHEALAV